MTTSEMTKQMFRRHKASIFVVRGQNTTIKVPNLRGISWLALFIVKSELGHKVPPQ